MLLFTIVSLANIYFFLMGLFKNIKFDTKRNKLPIQNNEKYNKLIYVVLDALRFDYTVEIPQTKQDIFHNNMSFYASLNKFHALSVCGIPTSTTCRITGLMTGTPSNYMQVLKTFFSSKVQVDNLIDQLHAHNSVSFYGDSTWIELFPSLKNCTSSLMDPYSKKDLEQKETRIVTDLLRNLPTSNYVFCHLIALDSYGHCYGIRHKVIVDTLKRYDSVIKNIYESMDENTLLVVTSDHGVKNEGSHGGVSMQEMSSVVSFISKRHLREFKPTTIALKTRKNFIDAFYDCDKLYFETKTTFPIVHQDDILPTLCYLLGVPIPKYAYGNFIPELVNSQLAYGILYKQKLSALQSLTNTINYKENGRDAIEGNYEATKQIYRTLTGKDFKFLLLSGVISVIVIYKYLPHNLDINHLVLLGLNSYVSFSVMAVINEDLFWLLAFLAFNLKLSNILCGLAYLGIDKNYGIYTEWLAQYKQEFFVDPYFIDSHKMVCAFILFFLYFIFLKPTITLKGFSSVLFEFPLILVSFYKYFFKTHFTPEYNWTLFISFLSPDILCVLLFRPLESIIILYISKFLNYEHSLLSLFILLNLSVGFSGMIKQIQCLNYDILYTFSCTPDALSASIICIFYFVYPRLLIFKRLFKSVKQKKQLLKEFLYFSYLTLFLSMLSAYYFFDSMLFYFHFAARCFFVCFYFAVDVGIVLCA